MKSKKGKYGVALEAKAADLMEALRNRGRLALEHCAEELEQILLKDEREFTMLAIDRDTQTLREVRSALVRVADGTFGVCEDCAKEIPPRRLDVVPWARRCVPCQEKADAAATQLPDDADGKVRLFAA